MANKKYKLANSDYWEASGVYDITEGKTQREVNAALKGSLNAIRSNVAEITGNTATRTISDGEIILKDNNLYVAIANINNGDTLTPNTNIKKINNIAQFLYSDYTSTTSAWLSELEADSSTLLRAYWYGHVASISFRGKVRNNHAENDLLFTLPEEMRPSAELYTFATLGAYVVPIQILKNGKALIYTIEPTVASIYGRLYMQITYITYGGNKLKGI